MDLSLNLRGESYVERHACNIERYAGAGYPNATSQVRQFAEKAGLGRPNWRRYASPN